MNSSVHLPRLLTSTLLCIFIFYPAIFDILAPRRVIAIVLGFIALAIEIWFLPRIRARVRLVAILTSALAVGLLVLAIEVLATTLDDRLFAVNAQHMLILAPLLGAVGYLAVRSGSARSYILALLIVGSITAGLAVVESVAGVSLFDRSDMFMQSQREGPTRALLASEHVLVLGGLLASVVPFAAAVRSVPVRVAITVLLVAGCWSTGSRAAATLSLAVAVLQSIPLLIRWIQRHIGIVLVAAGLGVLALGIVSTTLWTAYIPGTSGLDYSTNYRFAMYSLLPDILLAHPVGYLLQTIPAGEWIMSSDLRGEVDLAHTVDSEIVYAVMSMGWIGLATFLAIIGLAIVTLRSSPNLGLATLLLTGLGAVMSLHGWDAASLLWYALIGACLASTMRLRRHSPRTSTDHTRFGGTTSTPPHSLPGEPK